MFQQTWKTWHEHIAATELATETTTQIVIWFAIMKVVFSPPPMPLCWAFKFRELYLHDPISSFYTYHLIISIIYCNFIILISTVHLKCNFV